MKNDYLTSVVKQFAYYRQLGEKAIAQVQDEQLFWQYNGESNSVAIIVQHLCGNMLSRFTNFLTSDGEKEWRNREAEFLPVITTREDLLAFWQKGWSCLLEAMENLQEDDLLKIIYIRHQGHTVVAAINRQLAHYPYHIGQLVFICKMACNSNWRSLSIPKGNSADYNAGKFSREKQRVHFTDDLMDTPPPLS